MSRVILQPAGNADSREHFADTITRPVPLERIERFVDEKTITILNELYPEGVVPVWGVVPGAKQINRKKWEKVSRGDVVLFCRKKHVVDSAVVTSKTHNAPLAEELWGRDPKGATWEYIYFLDEVEGQSIPYELFNGYAGYKPNFVVQGFSVLDEDKSASVLEGLELASEAIFDEVSEEEFYKVTAELGSAPLDTTRTMKARTEQAFLRNNLFGKHKVDACCICGESFPVEFLVAAHLKKRSHCSDEEKRDWRNIVAPMCKFGCDELYERGYLGVVDGVVQRLKSDRSTACLGARLRRLEGLSCNKWSQERKKYFDWHVFINRRK